jgi:hypothetical protein
MPRLCYRAFSTVIINIILAVFLLMFTPVLVAQDLEPRAYSNAPVGLNFVFAGYQYSSGALLFDPSLPITDANARVDMGFLGYVRTLGVMGKSAKAGIVLPYADLSADGYLDGEYRKRDTIGPADPAFYFTMNLYGAPALGFKEFKDFRQDTIVGITVKVTPPLGDYDSEKLLNIGTNRWSIKPEVGVSKAIGRWTLEGAAGGFFYTDNTNFDGGKTRKQDPIYAAQVHVIYSLRNQAWASLSTTYFTGGRTSVDGVESDDLQRNWRTGFTLAYPLNRNHSIKLFGNSGVSTRTGTDYDALGVAWQYRWGGGG